MGDGKITFYSHELRRQPDGAFLSGFIDPSATRVATALIDWATGEGYLFRSGEGDIEPTEYIVRPCQRAGRQGIPLLTLEQATRLIGGTKGTVHVPFSRLRELGFTDPTSERRLFDVLNGALRPSRAMSIDALQPGKNGKHWGIIKYAHLTQDSVRGRFTSELSAFGESFS